MSHSYTLAELKERLEKFGFSYSVLGEEAVSKAAYRFASSRKVIPRGIYYLTIDSLSVLNAISESLILTDQPVDDPGSNVLVLLDQPQLAHYRLAADRPEQVSPGIHPTAVVHPEARVAESAHVGPYCILGKCTIGEGVNLLGSLSIMDDCVLGARTVVEPYSTIGARGMAWIWDEQGNRILQPQIGGVEIGEDCVLGSSITIVRGSLSENTEVGTGTVMAHGTRIGHGARIGRLVHFANNVSVAGNADIGNRAFLGSGSVISSNVSIGAGCIVAAGAVVHRSIHETYCTVAGVPAKIVRRNNFEAKPKGAPQPFQGEIENGPEL